MGLAVIGAGFGRTGTLSLKLALELLGFDPCYHMVEVIARAEHAALWWDAASEKLVNWGTLFGGYKAAVDWPSAHYWRELAARYPEARIILTVRDPESWYRSVYATIYRALTRLPDDTRGPGPDHRDVATRLVLEKTFHGRFGDREYALSVYERHNQEVQRAIPAERLLVYEVADGWAPLCRFLGRPVPEGEFPKVNSAAHFISRFVTADIEARQSTPACGPLLEE